MAKGRTGKGTPEDPMFFATQEAFRAWLTEHQDDEDGVLSVAYWKTGTGRGGLTYKQSVDEALCFGWIDGVRNSMGADSYRIRFTPRRPRSIWSAVNLKRIEELIAEGRVRPRGRAVYEGRDTTRAGLYAFEQREAAAFDAAQRKRFKANQAAWQYWEQQPPGYRQQVTWWVISAKKPETRDRRLQALIDDCAAGRRMAQTVWKPKDAKPAKPARR